MAVAGSEEERSWAFGATEEVVRHRVARYRFAEGRFYVGMDCLRAHLGIRGDKHGHDGAADNSVPTAPVGPSRTRPFPPLAWLAAGMSETLEEVSEGVV